MKFNSICLLALILIGFCSCEKEKSFKDDGLLVPLTVIEDSSLPSILINDVLLHSETYGDNTDPMIVVLHGGPGGDYRSLLNFKDLTEDGYFVVFYDQRGSGRSERLNAEAYSEVQVFIDELESVIAYYQTSASQKVVLAGHSWGAMLAAAYINQYPASIDAVILSEPGGFTWEQTEAYISRSRKLELFGELTNDFVYQAQFLTGDDHNTLDYKMALSTAGESATGDTGILPYWRFGAVCSSASIELAMNNPEQLDFTTQLHNYNTKVLYAYSELNTAYGQQHAEEVSSALSLVELVQIDGCGHEIPHFGWNSFYPIIQNYLNETI